MPYLCSPVDRPFTMVPEMCSWQRLLVNSTRGLSNGASPVYELRTYSLVPSKVQIDSFLLKYDFCQPLHSGGCLYGPEQGKVSPAD